jgi:hypothetical protein
LTNRGALLTLQGQTYFFVAFAPLYHLASPILDGETPIAFRESPEPALSAWFAGATAHQSMREAADLDAMLCGSGLQPVNAPLSQIRVPLRYIGAAGGVGVQGIYTTTQTASTDITTQIVQRFPAERRAEDFGHADLLFGTDAPAQVWQPLAAWLQQH